MSDVVTDGRSQESSPKKRILIIGSVIIFVIAIIVPIFLSLKSNDTSDTSSTHNKPTNTPQGDLNTLQPEGPLELSSAKAAEGDYAGAQAILEKELKSENNKNKRYDIYLQLTNNSVNADKYQEALMYAEEAKKIKDDYSPNELIGRIYEKLGNKQQAVAAYKRTIKIINDDPSYANDKILLQNRIKRLES